MRSACFGVATGVFAGGEEFKKFGRLPDGQAGNSAEIKAGPSDKFLQLNGYDSGFPLIDQAQSWHSNSYNSWEHDLIQLSE